MKIVDNRPTLAKTEFRKLNYGDVFEYGSVIHMKVNPAVTELGSVIYNTVNLSSGSGIRFSPNELVTPLVCRLVIDSI